MLGRLKSLAISAAILMVVAGRPASAQVTATISGRVEDPSGAAIAGATVTVKNLETGATRVVRTDDTGNFRALSLSVGRQEVKVEQIENFLSVAVPARVATLTRFRSTAGTRSRTHSARSPETLLSGRRVSQ